MSALALVAWWVSGIPKIREFLEPKLTLGQDVEVTIKGPVRNPGIYAVRTADSLETVVKFAGGLEKGLILKTELRERTLGELKTNSLDLEDLVTHTSLERGWENGKRKGQRYR